MVIIIKMMWKKSTKEAPERHFLVNLERKMFKNFVASKQTTSSPKTILNIALVISHLM